MPVFRFPFTKTNILKIKFVSIYDADAQDFFNRVVSNGGTISDSTKNAVNTFVLASKSNNYWSKINRINLFCGDNLNACLVPLKIGGGSNTETNNNFVAGDYSESAGLTGNGSTKYLNTGLNASVTLTAHDTHQSVYNRSSTASQSVNGSQDGTDRFSIDCPWSDGKVSDDQYDQTNGRVQTSSAIGTPFGFIIGTRTASNSHVIYRNGSSIASNTSSGGAIPNQNYYVFAQNNAGSASWYSNYIFAAYSIGLGLTSTDVSNLNTDMQAFQTALSRNV